MNKWLISALASSLLVGCSSVPTGSIPVVDSGTPASRLLDAPANRAPQAVAAQAASDDGGVVVMVPGGISSTPIQAYSAGNAPIESSATTPAWNASSIDTSGNGIVSGIPMANSALAQDEQLDGPVLALLTSAQQLQGSGDLNGAASSLERAQRIAPREPQVLYRLAEVRLAQGDSAQAEQFARKGLSYATGRPALQASLWELIAKARENQGDAAGAAQARQQARVSS